MTRQTQPSSPPPAPLRARERRRARRRSHADRSRVRRSRGGVRWTRTRRARRRRARRRRARRRRARRARRRPRVRTRRRTWTWLRRRRWRRRRPRAERSQQLSQPPPVRPRLNHSQLLLLLRRRRRRRRRHRREISSCERPPSPRHSRQLATLPNPAGVLGELSGQRRADVNIDVFRAQVWQQALPLAAQVSGLTLEEAWVASLERGCSTSCLLAWSPMFLALGRSERSFGREFCGRSLRSGRCHLSVYCQRGSLAYWTAVIRTPSSFHFSVHFCLRPRAPRPRSPPGSVPEPVRGAGGRCGDTPPRPPPPPRALPSPQPHPGACVALAVPGPRSPRALSPA